MIQRIRKRATEIENIPTVGSPLKLFTPQMIAIPIYCQFPRPSRNKGLGIPSGSPMWEAEKQYVDHQLHSQVF